MQTPSSLSGPTRQRLAEQLAGTRRALLGLVSTFEDPADPDGLAHSVHHQLKWATIHLHAAIAFLSGPQAEKPSNGSVTPSQADTASDEPAGTEDWRELSEGLKGHTDAVGIAELLGFIASLRKSGTLVCHGQREDFLIELREGAVVYAQGNAPPAELLLGQILVQQGALTRKTLEQFLATAKGPGEKVLGSELLAAGLITQEALCIALSFQIQHLFHRLYAEEKAYFQFEEGVRRIDNEDVRLNVQMLFLESARSKDETDRPIDAA